MNERSQAELPPALAPGNNDRAFGDEGPAVVTAKRAEHYVGSPTVLLFCARKPPALELVGTVSD